MSLHKLLQRLPKLSSVAILSLGLNVLKRKDSSWTPGWILPCNPPDLMVSSGDVLGCTLSMVTSPIRKESMILEVASFRLTFSYHVGPTKNPTMVASIKPDLQHIRQNNSNKSHK